MYVPLLDLRRYIFDLSVTLADGAGSRTALWRSNPGEIAALKQGASQANDGWMVVPDPSQFLSYELVARPTRRGFKNKIPQRGVGAGNVHMFNTELYYSTLLVEAKPEEQFWSRKHGAPRYQHGMTLRLLTGRFEIHYGDTDADHSCIWSMPPGVEDNKQLLEVPFLFESLFTCTIYNQINIHMPIHSYLLYI